jgi:predicted transcriptional regulator
MLNAPKPARHRPVLHVKYVLHVNRVGERTMPPIRKQNLTVSLSPQTVQKAKVLAAKRSTSISGLLAGQIEALVEAEEAYESAHRAALDLMERGFHMGGIHSIDREELHER